jgi:ferric-dicitrate binding protein FerR (iron transport regulator)
MEQTRLYDLIRKLADDTATPEEVQELHEWYGTVYSVGEVEWPADTGEEKQLLEQRIRERLRLAGAGAEVPRVRNIGRMKWIAAACVVLLAGLWMVWQQQRERGDVTVYNPSGSILQVTLPDSSRVWLNAASSLRYAKAFTRHRELYLEGEGYFDVAEDAAHPFTVHSGSLTTTVLGTSFDVRSFGTELSTMVTVIRGKVQVDNAGKVLDQLTPARQLQWDHRTGGSRTETVDTSNVLAWQHGKLQFPGDPLKSIAGSLERWYDMKIVFKDTAMGNCKLYASFDNKTSLPDILTAVSKVMDFQWTIDQKQRIVTLSGKGCQ